jgi:hypothetical protein
MPGFAHALFIIGILIMSIEVYRAFRKDSGIKTYNSWKKHMPFYLIGPLNDPEEYVKYHKAQVIMLLVLSTSFEVIAIIKSVNPG